MAEQGKVSGFRLPAETLEKLDDLIDEDIIRNRTDGVIRAIDRYYIEEYNQEHAFERMLSCIIHNRRIASGLDWIDEDARLVIVHDESGEEDYINKIDDYRVEVVRLFDLGKITAVLTFEPDGYRYDPDKDGRIVPIEGMQKNRDRLMEKTMEIGRKRAMKEKEKRSRSDDESPTD